MIEAREPESQAQAARIRRQAVAGMVRGERYVLHVRGNCMAPVLKDGQEVQLAPGRPWPGDIVAVSTRDDGIFVHRFLMRRPWFDPERKAWVWLLVTRPDQGTGFDPEVPAASLLGVVRQVRTGELKDDGEPPFRSLSIDTFDRARAVGWAVRYVLRRGLRWFSRVRSNRPRGRLP